MKRIIWLLLSTYNFTITKDRRDKLKISNIYLYKIKKDHLRENLVKYTRKAFELLPKYDNPRILDVGCGAGIPTMELAKLTGGHITGICLQSLKTKERKSPGLGYLIQFRMMRIHAIDTKEYFTADYKYYKEKGLLDKNKKYFIDSEINIFKNMFAGMMEKLILRSMSKSLSKKV